MSDVVASESGIRLNFTDMNASFKGSFTNEGIVGEMIQGSYYTPYVSEESV